MTLAVLYYTMAWAAPSSLALTLSCCVDAAVGPLQLSRKWFVLHGAFSLSWRGFTFFAVLVVLAVLYYMMA